LIYFFEVTVALSTQFGLAASFFQTIGTLFYTKIASGVPVFDFFPKVIGLALYMLSGFCWFMEALAEEPAQNKTRWAHIKSRFQDIKMSSAPLMVWGFAAGALTLVAGGLSLLALYAAASPLFWGVSALTALAGLCWLKSSQGNSVANHANQAAASLQIVSTGLFIAAIFFPPLAPLAILLGVASAGLWLSSYALDKMFPLVAQQHIDVIKPEDSVIIKWVGTEGGQETASHSPSNHGPDASAPVSAPLLFSRLSAVVDEYMPVIPLSDKVELK
jgi:hypothetical protein